MKPIKLLYFGTPEIATQPLVQLANDPRFEIVGVGTFPDKSVGRKRVLTPSPVKTCAVSLGLPVYELSSKQDLCHLFETVACDVALVIAFGMIFPKSILSVPRLGVLNVHFSLLPQYRGASPVQSAILDQQTVSGITVQKMVQALDAGDIVWQKEYDITEKGTGELWHFFAKETAQFLPEVMTKYADGALELIPQEEAAATFCSKFEKADGFVIPSSLSAEALYARYLAFDVWPGVFLELPEHFFGKTKKLQLKEMVLGQKPEKGIVMPCGTGFVTLLSVKLEGKTQMPADTFAHGNETISRWLRQGAR